MSAAHVVLEMLAAGMRWHLEGKAVRLQSSRTVPPEVIRSLNRNKADVLRLVRKNPTPHQVALLAELEGLNAQWDKEEEKEREGYPGETAEQVLARLAPIIDRASAIEQRLLAENPVLMEGVRVLFR